jgi:hypothetical protein
LLVEIIIGSSGRWFVLGPFTFRMIIFALCFLFSIPQIWNSRTQLLSNVIVKLTIILMVALVISTLFGLIQGNKLSYIYQDLSGMTILLLVPTLLSYSYLEQRLTILKRFETIIIFSTILLSLIITLIFFILPFLSSQEIVFFNEKINFFSLGALASISGKMFRIYFRSEIFLQIGYYLLLIKVINGEVSKKKYYLYLGLMIFALNITFTRSFWIGFLVSGVLLFVTYKNDFKRVVKPLLLSLVFFALLQCISFVVFLGHTPLEYSLGRLLITENESEKQEMINTSSNIYISNITDIDIIVSYGKSIGIFVDRTPLNSLNLNLGMIQNKTSSDDYRNSVVFVLLRKIMQSPIFGSGIGANIGELSNYARTEYMYLDLIFKMGIIGLMTYFSSLIYVVIMFFKKIQPVKRENKTLPFLIALAGVLVSSFFNPFLNNPIGLIYLMIVYFVFNVELTETLDQSRI